jgi:hypothetical protein
MKSEGRILLSSDFYARSFYVEVYSVGEVKKASPCKIYRFVTRLH